MRVYRVYAKRHHDSAFSGYGASIYGGRWNTKGVPVVYTASSLSLALLEIIANATEDEPPEYVYVAVDIPDEITVERRNESDLPRGWHVHPAPPSLQEIGDAWVRDNASVALVVPSAVARIESNVLLNPTHDDFARLVIGRPEDLPVDHRLPIVRRSRKR